MLIFDEYAESQSIKDTFSGADIHSTVAFCYQKLRKENGAVGTIVQSLAQLPDNEYTKGIIANTQLLYVLPANEIVYDQTVEAFHIKNRSHVNLMKSIRNDFSGYGRIRRYSSGLWIVMQRWYAWSFHRKNCLHSRPTARNGTNCRRFTRRPEAWKRP